MATAFKIEKGFPLPEASAAGRPRIYPWHEMDIGDSFLVPDCDRRKQQKVSSSSRLFGKRHKRAFATRRIGNDVRVWRVA